MENSAKKKIIPNFQNEQQQQHQKEKKIEIETAQMMENT